MFGISCVGLTCSMRLTAKKLQQISYDGTHYPYSRPALSACFIKFYQICHLSISLTV